MNPLWTGLNWESKKLTARYYDPDEIHEEVVTPEIPCFGSAIRDPFVVVIEHTGRVVEDITVDLPQTHHCLEWMSERMLESNHQRNAKRQRPPAELQVSQLFHLTVETQ